MPTNRELDDDDPEMLDLLKHGGLKAGTIKDRERCLAQFKDFVLKETRGVAIDELVMNKEGLERLDHLFPKYFLTMEVEVKEGGHVVKRRPKLGYAKKVRSALKCQIEEDYKINIFDVKQFPNHKKQWLSFVYKLATEGLAETEHFAEVDPVTMEAIMELINDVYEALAARGQPDYMSKLQKVPLGLQKDMHVVLQRGAHFIHNLFEVRRGGENSRDLRKSHFEIISDPVKNFKYIKHTRSEKDKNHRTGTQSSLHGCIPFLDLPKMNPGKIFAFYLSSLPGEPTLAKLKEDGTGGYLFPRPKWGAKFDIHSPKEKILYVANMPVGRDHINQMLPELTRIVGKPHATNHSLRSTAILYMRRAGLPWETIAKITGHKCTKNLIAYYDTYLEGQGFADVATAIGTGAGFTLGDAAVKVVLENRDGLRRPTEERGGSVVEDIKVFFKRLC